MRIIGYFKTGLTSDLSLTFADIQELSAVRSDWGNGDRFEIQARATSGAMTRVYRIRPADKSNEFGYRLFETQEEANTFLETIMSSAANDVIDLRKNGASHGYIENHMPLIRITNEWDEFTDSEAPIVVRIANNEENDE